MAREILVGELSDQRQVTVYFFYPLDGTTVVDDTTLPAARPGEVPTPATGLPQWAQDLLTAQEVTDLNNGDRRFVVETFRVPQGITPQEAAARARVLYAVRAAEIAQRDTRRFRFLGTFIDY